MKAITLISSGLDSPIAAYVLSNYFDEMVFLHVDGRPFTDDKEIQNFLTLANHLSTLLSSNTKIGIIPHGNCLTSYKESNVHPRFTCLFCKRMMVRYAEALANKLNASAIIMGDSLGQVASQTLANIAVVDDVVQIPILRPLIGMDKEEIVTISKDIGIYDYSILSSVGCLAVPQKPATKAEKEQLISIEAKIPIESLVKNAIESIEWI